MAELTDKERLDWLSLAIRNGDIRLFCMDSEHPCGITWRDSLTHWRNTHSQSLREVIDAAINTEQS